MMVLITYDVNTETEGGKRRLRKVAKQCINYGQRVQNSVFECIVDSAKLKEIQHKIVKLIDPEKDSLRFYIIGNQYQNKIEHFGVNHSMDLESTLIF